MSLQKTEAVVLKTQRLSETSKILTLYSLKFGKIKVVAKGARGLKSRFYGTLEPLNHIDIVYYFKETRELQLLSQAEIIHAFVNIRESLDKYAFATFFCELVEKTQLEQTNRTLFRSLVDVLTGLNNSKENDYNYFFWFILKFLQINGFKPHFDFCRICKTEQLQEHVRFSLIDGNFTCSNCSSPEPMSISVLPETIFYFRSLQGAPLKQIAELSCANIQNSETLLLAFLQYHIEETRFLKSLKFLKNIKNQN